MLYTPNAMELAAFARELPDPAVAWLRAMEYVKENPGGINSIRLHAQRRALSPREVTPLKLLHPGLDPDEARRTVSVLCITPDGATDIIVVNGRRNGRLPPLHIPPLTAKPARPAQALGLLARHLAKHGYAPCAPDPTD